MITPINNIFTTVVCFVMIAIFSPGVVWAADTPDASQAHPCKMAGKSCSCGKDCTGEHCKTGAGPCNCKMAGKSCSCGKDCTGEHCKAGAGQCNCKMDNKGCSCGKDCAGEHCKTGTGACPCRTQATSSETGSSAMMTVANIFKLSYTTDPARIPLNTFHSWTLTVQEASGKPVTDAEISIKGAMPLHGHGLPSAPRVTKDLGNGAYLIEGVKFMMPGKWEMTFTVKSGEKEDSATFVVTL